MKRFVVKGAVIVLGIFMLISCEDLFTGFTEVSQAYDSNASTSSYVDIPNGWEIEKNGAYSSITWTADFSIPSEGDKISFKDSAGTPIVLKKSTNSIVLSPDNPKATFNDGEIILNIRDLRLVFKRKS